MSHIRVEGSTPVVVVGTEFLTEALLDPISR